MSRITVAATILVFNAGSSNLKWSLFTADTLQETASGEIATGVAGKHFDLSIATRQILDSIDTNAVICIGHRVVHGGPSLTGPVFIDAAVRDAIAAVAELAPQHNTPALAVLDTVAEILPDTPQVSVFDTAFHASIPESAFLYGLPYAWYERYGVRRFGFHGISHEYCAGRAGDLLGADGTNLGLVSCHLGNGCSLAAIRGGTSIATTMGFTPLDGLVMGTRPGSVDPGILTWLLKTERIDLDALEQTLQHDSGLRGLSGRSGDMREIEALRAAGDVGATRAFDVFVFRLVEEIAAMAASLGGLDALSFTAGIGENSSRVRAAVCARLGWIGVRIDEARNAAVAADTEIGAADSTVRVLVIRTREALAIARECQRLLDRR